MGQEEIESTLKKLEAHIYDMQTSLHIIKKRVDKISCWCDNLEKAYQKHLNSFHTSDVI